MVNAALSIYISNLLPDAAFACSDRANSFEQFTEIVFPEYGCTLLQTLVIHCEAFADIFIENLCRPLTEMSGFERRNTVTNGNDGI